MESRDYFAGALRLCIVRLVGYRVNMNVFFLVEGRLKSMRYSVVLWGWPCLMGLGCVLNCFYGRFGCL